MADAEAEKLRVAVFGAAGQVGRAVVAKLLAAGHRVRAFERSDDAWAAGEAFYGGRPGGDVEVVVGDIIKYSDVDTAVAGCDAVVHTAVAFPPSVRRVMNEYDGSVAAAFEIGDAALAAEENDRNESGNVWLVNLKGLFNVLEASRVHRIRRVVHLGSARYDDPDGAFMDSEHRRSDGSLYAINKRLQEEMCRQHHGAHGTRIMVLRPDYIVDAELGIGRLQEALPGRVNARSGWVCRHDLADAVLLALSKGRDFDVLHTVHTTAPGRKTADEACNVARTRAELGWCPRASLERFRPSAPRLVDCHSHIWPAAPHPDYPLLSGTPAELLQPPSFATDELLGIMAAAGVSRCVLIGHGVFHGFDNSYLLDAASAHPDVFRVTAVLDEDADVVAQMRYLHPRGASSFRICPWVNGPKMMSGERKHAWLLPQMWQEAARSGQALCVLADPPELAEVSAMCASHPDTTVVIDHCGRVGCKGDTFPEADVAALLALAAHPNVHVKLSAFYALGKGAPPYEDVAPMLRALLGAFGTGRLLWGSDNPYQVAGSPPTGLPEAEADALYRASLEAIRSLRLGAEATAAVCGGNAERLFFGGKVGGGAA